MTFDEFFREFKLTPKERTLLVWHLASFRARRTVALLLNPETPEQRKRSSTTGGD